MLGQASDGYGRKPFLVLSEAARVGLPFSVIWFSQLRGSIIPYFLLSLIDSGFGTAGVMSAAVTDLVPRDHRAAAFGLLGASFAVGYCASAFVASFFSRVHMLQMAVVLFVARVLWAIVVVRESHPPEVQSRKTHAVVKSPLASMSILFRNQTLTSFVSTGVSQILTYYLNTVVGFNAKDFGILMLLGGVAALIAQGLLLQPLVTCMKEKGVIVLALFAYSLEGSVLAATAWYPLKELVFPITIPSSIGDLATPAISALMSTHVSDKEQGRLQGAIAGAGSVFVALGPVVFAALYATTTRQSIWSQALPFVIAALVNLAGLGVAVSLPTGQASSMTLPSSTATTKLGEDNDYVLEAEPGTEACLEEPLLRKESASFA